MSDGKQLRSYKIFTSSAPKIRKRKNIEMGKVVNFPLAAPFFLRQQRERNGETMETFRLIYSLSSRLHLIIQSVSLFNANFTLFL